MALGSHAPEMSGFPSAFFGGGPVGLPSPRPAPGAFGLGACAVRVRGATAAAKPNNAVTANILTAIEKVPFQEELCMLSDGGDNSLTLSISKMHAILVSCYSLYLR